MTPYERATLQAMSDRLNVAVVIADKALNEGDMETHGEQLVEALKVSSELDAYLSGWQW